MTVPVTLLCTFKYEKPRKAASEIDKRSRLCDAASALRQALGLPSENVLFAYKGTSGQQAVIVLEDVWIRAASAIAEAEAADEFKQYFKESLSTNPLSKLVTLSLVVSCAASRPASTFQPPAAPAAAAGAVVVANPAGSQHGGGNTKVRGLSACFAPGRSGSDLSQTLS